MTVPDSHTFKFRIAMHLWWFSCDNWSSAMAVHKLTLAMVKLRYQAIFNPQICTAFVRPLCVKSLSATMGRVGSLTSAPLLVAAGQLWHGRKCKGFQSVHKAAYQFNHSTWLPAAPLSTTAFWSDHTSAFLITARGQSSCSSLALMTTCNIWLKAQIPPNRHNKHFFFLNMN